MLVNTEQPTLVLPGWHIVTVTEAGLLYRDHQDIVCWIEFAACHERWHEVHADVGVADGRRCVGWRSTNHSSLLDVELYAGRRVRFEFTGYALRNELLLDPMQRYGWFTLQANVESP